MRDFKVKFLFFIFEQADFKSRFLRELFIEFELFIKRAIFMIFFF